MNKDNFGYYIVDSYKTYSKVEALEISHRLNKPVEWIFNDNAFGQYPWKINTKQDIKELYKKRAEQIRSRYDYIVVWYSGGADSFTVLNTFKENNIHVDEIAQFHSHEGEKGWNSYLNREIEEVAIPKTKEFLDSMPHTKHRMVDFTPLIKELFKEDNNRLDFIYKSNHSFSPHQLARTYFREKIQDYKKIIESGKKLCFVWGAEKTPVHYDHELKKYYLMFHDSIDGNGVGPRTQTLNRAWEHDEFFYWSTDSTDIIARQAHIIVDYLKDPPREDLNSMWLTKDPYWYCVSYDGSYIPLRTQMPWTKIDQRIYYLTTHGLHRLIYPDWKEQTLSLGKSVGYIFGPRDRWWHKQKEHDQEMFNSAMKSFYQRFKDSYVLYGQETSNDFRNINLKNFYSKKYYLE